MKTVAIIGLGARGYHTYAKYQHLHPEKMKITAIADPAAEKTELACREFGISEEMCFGSAEALFEKGKLADVLFVCTQDKQHKAHAVKGMELGYDLLLEKPVATTPEDVMEILSAALRLKRSVVVCHVLRYTKFYGLIKELLDRGGIGRVMAVQAAENVGYWHQAHSFVRGNWKNAEETSPMILQKCCHDFDIFNWLLGKRCLKVSSFGSLSWFCGENAPEKSAARCADCPLKEDCAYSSYKIYLDSRAVGYRNGRRTWPLDVVCEPLTEEGLLQALKDGPYGKCVFRCDNDVVDHQTVNLLYEGGVTVSFIMTGFTAENKRTLKLMGTEGEICADQGENTVKLTRFGELPEIYDVAKLTADLSGHGGGDNEMLTQMFDALERGVGNISSAIQNSTESHMTAFAAEYSRLHGGITVDMAEYCAGMQGKERNAKSFGDKK